MQSKRTALYGVQMHLHGVRLFIIITHAENYNEKYCFLTFLTTCHAGCAYLGSTISCSEKVKQAIWLTYHMIRQEQTHTHKLNIQVYCVVAIISLTTRLLFLTAFAFGVSTAVHSPNWSLSAAWRDSITAAQKTHAVRYSRCTFLKRHRTAESGKENT